MRARTMHKFLLKSAIHSEFMTLSLSLSKLFAANSDGRRLQPFEPELGIAMLTAGGIFYDGCECVCEAHSPGGCHQCSAFGEYCFRPWRRSRFRRIKWQRFRQW